MAGSRVSCCLLLVLVSVQLCDACHGSASFWEKRLCKNGTIVPPSEACAVAEEFLRCGRLTAVDIFMSDLEAENAWLLLARQTVAAFLNRLEASRYESVLGIQTDFVVAGSRDELLRFCEEDTESLPFLKTTSRRGLVFLELARRLYAYNDNASAIDLNWRPCTLGEGAVDKDRLPLGIDEGASAKSPSPELAFYRTATMVLAIMVAALLGSAVYLYMAGRRKGPPNAPREDQWRSELDTLVS